MREARREERRQYYRIINEQKRSTQIATEKRTKHNIRAQKIRTNPRQRATRRYAQVWLTLKRRRGRHNAQRNEEKRRAEKRRASQKIVEKINSDKNR